MKPVYSIRKATKDDYSLLPRIEQAAGLMYLQTQHTDLAFGPNVSQHIDPHDQVWVATFDNDVVAFAIVKVFDDGLHLHELDVHPDHARRGIGCALIGHVARWAMDNAIRSLTLTTFADVPWNGPYYARLGFETMDTPSSVGYLNQILDDERRAGFAMEHRIAMMLSLQQLDRTPR